LNITGLVEKPLALTLDELRRYDPLHQFVTLSCISNPVGGDLIGTASNPELLKVEKIQCADRHDYVTGP
jgi:DMSO/TMAO reductase YedYZ molybdopterin-dependent catalytic subunit